jgi:3-hydroxyacyl-[acyl-carrier-protein] dehydratase
MSTQSRSFGFQISVASAHPALPGHFPGRPIVPGVLLLDQVLTGVAGELQRPVSVLKQVKFAAPMLPGEIAMVACEATGNSLKFSVQARRASALVTLATGIAILAHRATPLQARQIAGGSTLA